MSNTLAQNPAVASFSAATSVARIFGGAGTNPSLYVATATAEFNTPTVTVSDDKNAGNYTQDSASVGATSAGIATVNSKQNTSTGTATITANFSVSCYGSLKTYELTGAATSSALDTQNTAEDGSGVTSRSVAITTNTDNCTVISAGANYPNDAAADTNYTGAFTPAAGAGAYHFGEYRVDAGTHGAITLTYAAPGNSSYWTMAVAAYKTAGGAAVVGGWGRLIGGERFNHVVPG